MSKEIAGVKLEPGMARRRGKRGAKAVTIAKAKKAAKEIIEGVPNFATKQLIRNKNYVEYEKYKNSKEQGILTGNAPHQDVVLGRQYAKFRSISPKRRVRYFLKEELSDKPDNNGRFALYAGFSATEPPSTFLTAFLHREAAQTARLLAFKEGTYIQVNVVDRGPEYNFQTVHKVKRAI